MSKVIILNNQNGLSYLVKDKISLISESNSQHKFYLTVYCDNLAITEEFDSNDNRHARIIELIKMLHE